jgi:hypothetical protein
MNVPDLLEQMTWAIDEGGPTKPAIFEFLSNIAYAQGTIGPSASYPVRFPTGTYAEDVLPLLHQIAWALGDPVRTTEVATFIVTLTLYVANNKNPKLNTRGPYPKPTLAPMPEALRFLMPPEKISPLLQVIYWMINEGEEKHPKAWAFLKAVAARIGGSGQPVHTGVGPYQYPYPQ